MNPLKGRPIYTISALLLLAIALVVVGLAFDPRQKKDSQLGGVTSARTPAFIKSEEFEENDDQEQLKKEPIRPATPPDPVCLAAIDRALADLRQAKTPSDAVEILQRLRESILSSQEQEAASAIIVFLRRGQDAPTGLPFDVGSEGMLDSPPSLRIMLLDILPSLDPYASVEVARQIIADGRSQDEYAMALRNLAWNDLDGDMTAELSRAFTLMIERDDWRMNPSAGFLEAFDIAVQVGGTKMFDQVAGIITAEPSLGTDDTIVVNRAAFMALDSIVMRDPSILVTKFSSNPAFLDETPRLRASVMSRLDIEQPAQRELFIRYLESMNHADGELEYFSRLFPNGNYLYGHRLVTEQEATPSIKERQAMDQRVLGLVKAIEPSLADGEAKSAAAVIAKRLESFLAPSSSFP